MASTHSAGDHVRVAGFLARTDLDEKVVILQEWSPSRERWLATVEETGESVSIRPHMIDGISLRAEEEERVKRQRLVGEAEARRKVQSELAAQKLEAMKKAVIKEKSAAIAAEVARWARERLATAKDHTPVEGTLERLPPDLLLRIVEDVVGTCWHGRLAADRQLRRHHTALEYLLLTSRLFRGTVEDVLGLAALALAKQLAATPPPPLRAEVEEAEAVEAAELAARLTVPELRKALADRSLETDGLKAALLGRLQLELEAEKQRPRVALSPSNLTAQRAVQQAEAEGLTLLRAANATGFLGVICRDGHSCPGAAGGRFPYEASAYLGLVPLGCFATAEGAALAFAQAVAASPATSASSAPSSSHELPTGLTARGTRVARLHHALRCCPGIDATAINNPYMNLRVVAHGSDNFYKMRLHTPLEKLMHAFCNRHGVSMGDVRFLFDGDRINEAQTPDELEMEDGDVIDVMFQAGHDDDDDNGL